MTEQNDKQIKEQHTRNSAIVRNVGELIVHLTKLAAKHGKDTKVVISIPFRNGIGLHYENIKNISAHEGNIDIHTTVPENDDVVDPMHTIFPD